MQILKKWLIVLFLLFLVCTQGSSFRRRRRRRRRSPPVVNCAWGPWTEGPCSHACENSGTLTRRRVQTTHASGGGLQCKGDGVETIRCNRFCYNGGTPSEEGCSCKDPYYGTCCDNCTSTQCEWSEWGSWSECTPNCGVNRYKIRNRDIMKEAVCGGAPCNGTSTERNECEPLCLNNGLIINDKCKCTTPYSGDCCEVCNAVDCTWTQWGEWASCDPLCGVDRQRTRERRQNPSICGGNPCVGLHLETEDCEPLCYNGGVPSGGSCSCTQEYTGQCCDSCVSLNCTWGPWTLWSPCQPPCGNNRTRTRQRAILHQAKCGGICDTDLAQETEQCGSYCLHGGTPMNGYCECDTPFSGTCCDVCAAVNCQWSHWGRWSACDPVCGAVRNRTRSMFIAEHPQCGGNECGQQPVETTMCESLCFHEGTAIGDHCYCKPSFTGSCCHVCAPTDCVWEEWSSWSPCAPECGTQRIQTRTRRILTPESCGGLECIGETFQNQTCSSICFNGGTPDDNQCLCPPSFNGECCGSCEPKDCHWETWQEWSACQPQCGRNRQKKRIRTILAHATCEGLCPGSSTDVVSCNDTCDHDGTPMDGYCLCQRPFSGTCCEQCILSDCQLSSWSQWSECSPECGVNRTRTRIRSVEHEAECGGLTCADDLTDLESCSSLCFHGGVATGDTCSCHSPYKGACCIQCDPTDCTFSEWSSWSDCLPICGNNRSQQRTRYVTTPQSCGGQCVSNTTVSRPCKPICYNAGISISSGECQCKVPFTGSCCETCHSVNCTWGTWQPWSECQPKCGSSRQRSRIRTLESQPICGGTCSGSPIETDTCEDLCFNGGTPVDGHCQCPFPFSTISCCKSSDGDPCIYHSLVNDRWRSVGNSELIHRSSSCDVNMTSEIWYRFKSISGEQIIDRCVTINKCGVHFPIWLKGRHPVDTGNEVERHACVSKSEDGITKCCEHKKPIKIKKCSDFYIYKLASVRSCDEGYCSGEEAPCPPGTSSPNGYTPNCLAPPPELSEPELYIKETSDGFHLTCVFSYPDSNNVSFDVIWSSEKDELYRETLSQSRKSILHKDKIDDTHLLIYCKVTGKFLYDDGTAKSAPSHAVSSRSILLSLEEFERTPEINNNTSKTRASTRSQSESSDNTNSFILPTGIGVGILVLVIIVVFTIIIIKNKRLRLPSSSKLFILNSNKHGSCEEIFSRKDENNTSL
ncbi:SCO-spondin-like [Antedon mediterranea]|uniref:SCO-spondin-like n=1 Tax=Antedon mediterranea TaxID=105859 RepID=UPI003AF90DC1